VGHVAHVGERRSAYRILEEKPGRNRPIERTRRIRAYNIKTDIQEMECGGMDWIDVAQKRGRWRALVNAVMNLLVL